MVQGAKFYSNIENVTKGLFQQNYIVNKKISTAVFLAGRLGKPLLIEGPAGVGKTGLANAIAEALGTDLVRLQCYPGLDESKTLYEWNYQKQLVHIQMYGREADIFSAEYLLERPLLQAFRASKPVVLLIDEIDKSEEELESFLLEALSEYQVTIPEYGTVSALNKPYVVITSNNTRELSDALKRRCLYLYIPYPDADLEQTILSKKVPGLSDNFCRAIVDLVQQIRMTNLKKAPSITESIDWARTLLLLGREEIDAELVRESLNVLLKYEEDIKTVENQIDTMIPPKIEETTTASMENSPPLKYDAENDLSRFDF